MLLFLGPRFETMGILNTENFYKSTSNFLYLHSSSHHPPHVFKVVALGETLRILRNCSQEDTFECHRSKLIDKLKSRAYLSLPPLRAESSMRSTSHWPWQNANWKALCCQTTRNFEIFVTTKYNSVIPSLAKTLHTHWLAIESDPHHTYIADLRHPLWLSTLGANPWRR